MLYIISGKALPLNNAEIDIRSIASRHNATGSSPHNANIHSPIAHKPTIA